MKKYFLKGRQVTFWDYRDSRLPGNKKSTVTLATIKKAFSSPASNKRFNFLLISIFNVKVVKKMQHTQKFQGSRTFQTKDHQQRYCANINADNFNFT